MQIADGLRPPRRVIGSPRSVSSGQRTSQSASHEGETPGRPLPFFLKAARPRVRSLRIMHRCIEQFPLEREATARKYFTPTDGMAGKRFPPAGIASRSRITLASRRADVSAPRPAIPADQLAADLAAEVARHPADFPPSSRTITIDHALIVGP